LRAKIEEEEYAMLLLIFILSATQHKAPAGSTVVRDAGHSFAKVEAAQLASEYVSNSMKDLISMQVKWDQQVLLGRRITIPEVRSGLRQLIGPKRNIDYVSTYMTKGAIHGAEFAARLLGYVHDDDIWWTRDDDRVCKRCGPMHGMPRSVWAREYAKGPPAHYRCRCWIDYKSITGDEPGGERAPSEVPTAGVVIH